MTVRTVLKASSSFFPETDNGIVAALFHITDSKPQFHSGDTATIFTGAGSKTARTAIAEALIRRKPGHYVIALTSQPVSTPEHPYLHYYQVDREQLVEPGYFQRVIQAALDKRQGPPLRHLIGVNLIGAPTASSQKELAHVNEGIPFSFATAIQEVGKKYAQRTSFGQVSTIAASILPEYGEDYCLYPVIKDRLDRRLVDELTINGNVTILRPGLVCPRPDLEGRVHMGHEGSPEQMAHLPLLPFIGSGEQPIPITSEECFYHTLFNGLEKEEPSRLIIDAVSENVSQKGLVTHFNKIAKVAVHIPYETAHAFTRHYPLERIAPYTTCMFEVLDKDSRMIESEDYKELHGGHCKTYSQIYPEDACVVTRSSPILPLMANMAKSVALNPEPFLFDFLPTALGNLGKFEFSWIRR